MASANCTAATGSAHGHSIGRTHLGTPGSRGAAEERSRNSGRRRRKPWRKLLWVKQDYPDNWVDSSFLDQLQRNINVHPYSFWSLVAESTVITQHLSSVVIFIVCFVAIFAERVSPIFVAGGSSALTVLGYWIWDMGWEVREAAVKKKPGGGGGVASTGPQDGGKASSQTIGMSSSSQSPQYKKDKPNKNQLSAVDPAWRSQQQRLRRMSTAKSALLIYCTLLGLSPILRSLTESISSDSIWAISTWLFLANCLSFDYGSDVTIKFPASLSTNAAIMASVVLASRLPTTTHVFSLVLFSIEVFGLFPVFRRYLRHISWTGHVTLTVALVCGASFGLGLVVGWGWAWGWIGLMGPGIMGGCSWWLIWLQRYKNEIHGPWDPAKPVIRTQWEG